MTAPLWQPERARQHRSDVRRRPSRWTPTLLVLAVSIGSGIGLQAAAKEPVAEVAKRKQAKKPRRPARGPRGRQGPAGPQGFAGPTGPQGAPGLSGVHVVSAYASRPASSIYVQADCPPGEVAVSGGFWVMFSSDWPSKSVPVPQTGVAPTGWGATLQATSAVAGGTVYAVCARVG